MACGIVLVDKESGWTSHDVVAKLKGVFRERRVGHSGTLDPMATGLLTVFVGRATRAVEFAEADEKEYEFTLRTGLRTDTEDTTGAVLSRSDMAVHSGDVLAVLPRFIGEIDQTPPMYSAIKIDGKKLYQYARAGKSVEREPRRVTVRALELLGEGEDGFRLRCTVSKGTYIRTLCADIGEAIGCGGAMAALRRTRAGSFRVEDASKVGALSEEALEGRAEARLLSVDALFAAYPSLTVDEGGARRCRNALSFPCDAPEGRCRVYAPDGEFLMLGQVEDGQLKTVKSFFKVG